MLKGFTRPSPAALLGALVRHEEMQVFGQVVYIHALGDRLVLECRGAGGEEFEVLLFLQQVATGVFQLVLEMPYADWDWFDTGAYDDPHRAIRRHMWRAFPNEE